MGALGAICLYLIVQPHNVGFSPDSLAYLEMAENFFEGKGIVNNEGVIIDHWPPFFPMAIALTAKITRLTTLESGMVLQPFLLYSSIVIFLFILKKLGLNRKLIHFSALLLIVSPLIGNFSWFLSEGLFYVFLLLSFYSFLEWFEKLNRKFLILTGVFCGFLFLTRYAGVGFIGGYILAIIIFNKKTPIRGIKDLIYLLLPLILTVIPWFLYIYFFKGNPAVRHFDIHLISNSKLLDLLKTLGFWFLGSLLARMSFAALMVFYLLFLFNRSLRELIENFYKRFSATFLMIFLLCSAYISFLIISISFYDSWTPLDNRILSPIFIFIFILVLLFLQFLHEEKFTSLLIATCGFLLLSFSSSTLPSHQIHFLHGKGYTKEKWSQSETLQEWKKAKRNVPVYTNGTELGYIHLGQRFKSLPLKGSEAKVDILLRMVRDGNAEILFLNNIDWKNYLVSPQIFLIDTSGLNVNFFEDGFILRATSE